MKRILFISLVLALLVTLLLPSMAMAKPSKTDFLATGSLKSIDEGNVKPLGDTGRWLVSDRHIQGSFDPGADLAGDFTITYGGIFKIADQSGKLIGKLETGSSSCVVLGEAQPLLIAGYPSFDGVDVVIPALMAVSGSWTGLRGLSANGEFSANLLLNVYANPADPVHYGHVKSVASGSFKMTGKYYSNR